MSSCPEAEKKLSKSEREEQIPDNNGLLLRYVSGVLVAVFVFALPVLLGARPTEGTLLQVVGVGAGELGRPVALKAR